MKYTVSDFEKALAKVTQTRETLKREIDDLIRQEAELDAAANAAADADDVDGFMQKRAAKDRASATLFVKRRQLDKLGAGVTEDDARNAWVDYAGTYSKKLAAGLKAFAAEKQKLCEMYDELVTLQEEALAVRERLGNAVGADKNTFAMDYIPVIGGVSAKGTIKIGGFCGADPDAVYFLSAYCVKHDKTIVPISARDPMEERITRVVIRRGN